MKAIRHVAARGAVDDEPAEAGHQKREERDVAPLARRDPDLAGEQHHRDDAEVRRVEEVLAVESKDELAGDGDDGGRSARPTEFVRSSKHSDRPEIRALRGSNAGSFQSRVQAYCVTSATARIVAARSPAISKSRTSIP